MSIYFEKPQKHPIDTSNWKMFRVGDLFEIENGKASSSNNKPGSIALINAGGTNQGVLGKFDIEAPYVNKITIVGQGDGASGVAFYHDYPFNATSCVRVLTEKFEGLTKYNAAFLCAIFTKLFHESGKYNFSYGLSQSRLKSEQIPLPVDSNGNPDWAWMDKAARDIEERSILIQAIKQNRKRE